MSDLALRTLWCTPHGHSEYDITLANLRIELDGKNVTEFRSPVIGDGEDLRVPVYNLAEWIAENWWPLLWEPQKNEDHGEEAEFHFRHAFPAAEGGFPLPHVSVVPQGSVVQVLARPRRVQVDDVHFSRGAAKLIPRKELEASLRGFVARAVSRLAENGIVDTLLQQHWALVEATTPETELFCRCMGALGVSPYADDIEHLEKLLDVAAETLGERMLLDLCLASTPDQFERAWALAQAASRSAVTEIDLSTLRTVSLPAETAAPAWRRGKNAASKLREKLGIDGEDPRGSDKLFAKLGIATWENDPGGLSADDLPIVGVTHRAEEAVARLKLLQRTPQQRRFSTARGIYTAWASERGEGRLMTMAVTRDQQSSRAFAAEISAPLAYIRRKSKGRLTPAIVADIANECRVAPSIVWKNAENSGVIALR